MTTPANKPKLVITNTFSDLVTKFNTVSIDLGATGSLNTSQDSDVVGAINEIEADLFNAEGGDKRTLASLTTTDKTCIVDAINEIDAELGTITAVAMGTDASTVSGAIAEIEGVFDASAKGISAGSDAFDIASGAFSVDASGAITLDATGDIVLKDAGVVFSTLENSSGNLILKSGTTTALTFSGANVTMAGTITPSASLDTSATTVTAAINENHTEVTSATTNIATLNTNIGTINATNLGTTASTVVTAIKEVHDEGATATSNISTNTTAISTINTKLGTITAAAMGTTASTVEGAIFELEQEIDTINSNGASQNNDAIGTIGNLNTTATNLVAAVNEIEADLFNAEGGTKRTLSSLTTTDKTCIVDAINELKASIPLIYAADGTTVLNQE